MTPSRGWLYRLDEVEGARASRVLVLSEDDWNRATSDAVVVPLYDNRPAAQIRYVLRSSASGPIARSSVVFPRSSWPRS